MKRFLLLIASFAVLIALGISPLFFGSVVDYVSRRPFDAIAWQDASQAQRGIRLRMMDDLLAQHPLEGMTQAQILTLLGEPDDALYIGNRYIAYWLGEKLGPIGEESAWLVLDLDDSGVVIGFEITLD